MPSLRRHRFGLRHHLADDASTRPGWRTSSSSVPPVSALIGLNATLPSSFTQISWRNRVVIGHRKPGGDQRLGDRAAALGLGAVRLAEADALPSVCRMTPGSTMSVAKYASDPTTRRGSIAAAMTPPGSTRSSRSPSSSPPMLWKYHHGMPFCVLTTTVSGPSSGRSCGASAVRLCALTPRNDHVGAADRRRDRRSTCGLHLEVAVRADHAQPALLHRAQVRAAREQHDVGAGLREPRADVAADRAGAGDDDLHDAFVRRERLARRRRAESCRSRCAGSSR